MLVLVEAERGLDCFHVVVVVVIVEKEAKSSVVSFDILLFCS